MLSTEDAPFASYAPVLKPVDTIAATVIGPEPIHQHPILASKSQMQLHEARTNERITELQHHLRILAKEREKTISETILLERQLAEWRAKLEKKQAQVRLIAAVHRRRAYCGITSFKRRVLWCVPSLIKAFEGRSQWDYLVRPGIPPERGHSISPTRCI